MYSRRISLQTRVFFWMVLLVLISSVLIGVVTVIQYHEQSEEYNLGRLERKETAIKNHIQVEYKKSDKNNDGVEKLNEVFATKIFDIAQIHRLDIQIYDLKGDLILCSIEDIEKDSLHQPIAPYILETLAKGGDHRFVKQDELNDKEYQTSYAYLYDNQGNEIGILNIPYLEDLTQQERELFEFFGRLSIGFFLMFLIGMTFAYFISSYITKSIKTISDKMIKTRLEKRNEKIVIEAGTKEIYKLVDAYNSMVDELEQSVVKIAKGEREQAWREMAKQVAHEIKNPLTPMRLTVQSFERKFDPNDPDIEAKLHEYSKTIIQQIDVMSSIATAFSDFAKMPQRKNEEINIVEVVQGATEIFTETFITFKSSETTIIANLDKVQVTRVITNLIKNSIQAMEGIDKPLLEVEVLNVDDIIRITVKDNGKGIPDELKEKVFEPKFTTKTSGMGLGLPMIKNIIEAYEGCITFISSEKETVFTVEIPKK